jgi:hypothetical protein
VSNLGQCGLEHDPKPWVSYTMSTGQNGWGGQEKFSPRPGYCQEVDCYYPTTEREK